MGTADLATVVAVVAIVAVAALALVGVLAVARRRERRVIASLLERLEQLEAQWAERGDENGVARHLESLGRALIAAPSDPEAGDAASVALSADVLAGMTSRVRRIVASNGAAAKTLADQAIFRIQSNMQTNFTPSQLADVLFVSLRTLERGLAVGLGCTPGQLILAMKMREARRLLLTGQHRVAEVADRLGFANPFHFSRRFKAFYRVAPSELRQTGGAAL